jgi:hypothetical protein
MRSPTAHQARTPVSRNIETEPAGVDRQTSWIRPDGTTVGYGYDNASNRTTTTTGTNTRTSTFDERNRLLTETGGGQPGMANTWSAHVSNGAASGRDCHADSRP